MKKIAILVSCLLMICALLTACGEDTNLQTPTTGTTAPTTDPTSAPATTPTEEPHTHVFGQWVTVKESSCAEAGQQERVCDCGEKETQGLDRTAHTFSEWLTIKDASCEEKGLSQRYCSVCNYTESKAIDATGHSEEMIPAVEATCTEEGLSEGKRCAVCEVIIEEPQKVNATGHIFEEGICICGLTDGTYTEGIEYGFVRDDFGNAIGFKAMSRDTDIVNSDPHLRIPPVFWNKLPVMHICYGVFAGLDGITTVTIPDSVTFIDDEAFKYCENLTTVNLGNGVEHIGVHAFADCSNLTSIIYNGTIEQWNAINKDSGWDWHTGAYTVYCTDGTISK